MLAKGTRKPASDARAGNRVVVCAVGVRRCVGIDAGAEVALDAEDLPVSPARLEGDLADEVGRSVEGVVCGGVIQAAAGARRTNQQISGKARARRVERLGILSRHAEEEPLAEILADAEAVLTGPYEAGGIL